MLHELTTRLVAFAGGSLTGVQLRAWLDAVLAADPLGVDESEAGAWEEAPDETRLFWRLVYLFDVHGVGAEARDDCDDEHRRRAERVVRCLEDTGSAATTLELLPLVEDQERFATIVRKHVAGIISRTGFLSVVAESGYPGHVKLWLEHAGPQPLLRVAAALAAGDYARVSRDFEQAPER